MEKLYTDNKKYFMSWKNDQNHVPPLENNDVRPLIGTYVLKPLNEMGRMGKELKDI